MDCLLLTLITLISLIMAFTIARKKYYCCSRVACLSGWLPVLQQPKATRYAAVFQLFIQRRDGDKNLLLADVRDWWDSIVISILADDYANSSEK